LTLKDVAQTTHFHESTISRVTSHKYVQTPRGIFELKFFFSGGFRMEGGMEISVPAVKEKLKELIESENPYEPFGDQRLGDLLAGQGIPIARRTVAKYREELGIPTSGQRKRS
jgi:RNA polymerase sigma-54 factor